MMRPFLIPGLAALAMAAMPALAQKGQSDGAAMVLPFGAGSLGADGQAAIGAGLRLFPGTPATPAPVPVPVAPAIVVPPAPQGGGAGLPTAKPASLPAQPPTIGGKPVPQAAAPRSPTAFAPVPAVSARVRQQVLAAMLPTSPNPAGLRAAVESGRPWQEFDRMLAQHGYDSRDLADVVAAFYLIAWEVSTGGDALAQPAGIAAVRGQARQMVAGNPAMARLDEAGRQATAETLAFYAMAMSARLADLRAAGAPGPVASFRAEVAQTVAQQQGIDLRRFTLTASGFQQR
ncbi:hypothetical protein J5Y09_18620 [Roseomonas sp. PWR1]|uniref:Uncharacterized protein n=1 Tax=Roseomonas nitratireducens TaxID=2820810 RepID=A0ABS4AX52_9PROT|nr:DUF6683 family protein [Neoroseomonas nitratireducens]MBP0465947.1 hypothetical protein [Neoroseomonas nitratireducens]